MYLKIIILLAFCAPQLTAINYVVTASEKFQPNTDYKFIVTIYGENNFSYQLKARIKNIESGDSIAEAEFQVEHPGNSDIFQLQIPRFVHSGMFEYTIEASGNITFRRSHSVTLQKKSHSLFIQTDKYLYKPGQTVLFRILGIQADLKPYTDNISIIIYDQSGNKISELLNKNNKSGVISGSLKLSHITPFGRWKIEAKSETLEKKAYFEVAEYVLPKFEVKVLTPGYIFVNPNPSSSQQPVLITITATYTFGQRVNGYASMSMKLQNMWSDIMQVTRNAELIDGKAEISFPAEEFSQIRVGHQSHSLFVQANVTEAVTGVILQGNSTIPIKPFRYEMKFLDVSSNNFKPGFPYAAHIKLYQPDGSEPKLSDIRYPNGTFKSLEVRLTYRDNYYYHRSPSRGALPDSSSFNVPLTANGYVLCKIPIELADIVTIKATFYDDETQRQVEASKALKLFLTRDEKHIQLSLLNGDTVLKPRSSLHFNIRASENINSYQYQIIGKGKIHHSDLHYLENPSNNITFSIFVSEHMALNLAPQATIVVFYVTSTGELVADSLSLPVTEYMTNKVSLFINPESTSPGEEVLIRVNASQDSFVSLSAIDQSVLLLSAGNEISHEMLYKDLNKYTSDKTLSNDDLIFWRFCWPIWVVGSSTDRLLKYSGLFVLTNFHINTVNPRNLSIYYSHIRYSPGRAGTFVRMPGLPGARHSMDYYPSLDHPPLNSVLRPRIKFPETWIWSDVQVRKELATERGCKVHLTKSNCEYEPLRQHTVQSCI